MAVAQVHQREIVEVPFSLPDGDISQQSYFVTHIVGQFNCDDVINRHNCFLRQPYFDQVIDKIIGTIIDGDF